MRCLQHGTNIHDTTTIECKRGERTKKGEKSEALPRIYQVFTHNVHTHDPWIMASHALLLCKVLMKWPRFGSAAASGFGAVAVLVTPESTTAAASCGYECGAWSSIGGGVINRGDGDGDGDKDSGGVELVECYSPSICTSKRRQKRKGTRVSSLTDEKEAAPRAILRYGRWRGCERTVKIRREGPFACACAWDCGCGWA